MSEPTVALPGRRPGHPFDLTGRLAVVTGARRGLGLAMASALAAAGADVVGVSARLEDEGSDVQRAVEAVLHGVPGRLP
jgi:2-deoxy-D-gluconate 3-dehydrogenase